MSSFSDKIKKIFKQIEPEEDLKKVRISCSNFWCKAKFEEFKVKLKENKEYYSQCSKCRSFSGELSGGVENNGTKHYDGDRFDNEPHEILYKEYKNKNAGFR